MDKGMEIMDGIKRKLSRMQRKSRMRRAGASSSAIAEVDNEDILDIDSTFDLQQAQFGDTDTSEGYKPDTTSFTVDTNTYDNSSSSDSGSSYDSGSSDSGGD